MCKHQHAVMLLCPNIAKRIPQVTDVEKLSLIKRLRKLGIAGVEQEKSLEDVGLEVHDENSTFGNEVHVEPELSISIDLLRQQFDEQLKLLPEDTQIKMMRAFTAQIVAKVNSLNKQPANTKSVHQPLYRKAKK